MRFFMGLIMLLGASITNAEVSWDRVEAIWSHIQNKAGYHVVLKKNKSIEVNALTNLYRIELYEGLLKYCTDEAEVALVLGHELGHWIHQDPRTRRQSALFELRADKIGLKLCKEAGFSTKKCLLFMERMKKDYGDGGEDGIHPPWSKRIREAQK